jgi:hypothetical protein
LRGERYFCRHGRLQAVGDRGSGAGPACHQ